MCIRDRNVHFTLGGPWYKQYENQDYADEWLEMHKQSTQVGL